MQKKGLKENTFFILIGLVKDFFLSLAQSVTLFFGALTLKKQKTLKENTFLDATNFFFQIGPKAFWKTPS